MMAARRWGIMVLAVILVLPGTVTGQQKRPATVAELALYKGADRQQILEEGARKEGKLIFYTTGVMAGSLGPFLEMFRKKYPYIKLDMWRSNSVQVANRILEEYRAGNHAVDVVEGTQIAHLTLKEQGILQPFYSPHLAAIEEGAITKAPGGGAFSAAFRLHGVGFGFNTKLLTREEAPKTYQDLLHPKWKGKMTYAGGGTSVDWMGTMLTTYGEEFVRKVAQQKFVHHTMSARGLLDLIIAREYACSPTIFESHVTASRQRGAPVDWIPLEPVHVNITQMALPKHAGNPHAALLLMDLKFTRESAIIEKSLGYVPTRKDMPVGRTYKKFFGVHSLVEVRKWQQMFSTLFVAK